MESKIKEACSCGASLEFQEVVKYDYQRNTVTVQTAFHLTHAPCRTPVIADRGTTFEQLEENERYASDTH